MTYEIKELGNGHFAVMEMGPVEIARFGSPNHARLFVERVLEAGARGAVTGTLEAAPEQGKTPEARAGLPPLGGFTGELIRQADHGAGASEDNPWEAALARVAGGEGCKDVAEDMGLSFASLRARCANRKRQEAPAAEPEVKLAAENGRDTRSDPANLPVPVRDMPMPARRAAGGALALPDEVEDVRGRPDLVARHKAVWTDEIDMAVIEAGDDEEKLWRVAAQTGASIERVRRRQTTLMEQIAKEIGR